jgi:carbonic anhydrase/acetyltransferase-like protein (isoleucine patch superfamily)
MIQGFLGCQPLISATAFVAESADIIGDVHIGEQSSVWFNTTIRGDVNAIRIGDRSSVQDNVCIHVMNQTGPTIIGNDVTIGHGAVVHGCTVHDSVLIGMNATLLDKCVIESEVIIAAGTLVPPGKTLASGYLYMGSPAKAVRPLSDEERASITQYAQNYIKYSRVYRGEHSIEENPFYNRQEFNAGKHEPKDPSHT